MYLLVHIYHLPIDELCIDELCIDELCYCVGTRSSKQKTFYVYLKKTTGKDPGFIFHEDVHHFSGVSC